MLDPAQPEPEPEPAPEPPKQGFWARMFRRRPPEPPPPRREPMEPQPLPAIDAAPGTAVLANTLDALGTAHHRPFSR
jgi:hypothetical protein